MLEALHDSDDPEAAGSMADQLLLDYINNERISEAYDKVPRWYAQCT